MSQFITDNVHTLKGGGEVNVETGTPDADTLVGTAGDDKISGNAGDDVLSDLLGGNDVLLGGAGNDAITVARAAASTDNVHVEGGLGDDTITFNGAVGNLAVLAIDGGGGANTFDFTNMFSGKIYGGADVDTVTVSVDGAADHALLIHTAAGDDVVNVSTDNGDSRVGIATGAGADTVNINSDNFAHDRMRLGEGQDVVNVAASTSGHDIDTASQIKLVFWDFQAGDDGDQLNITKYLNSVLSHDFHGDLFDSHHLQLVNGVDPNGDAAAFLEMDLDGDKNGADWVKIATFVGVDANDITAFNLGGIDPTVTPASPDGLVT